MRDTNRKRRREKENEVGVGRETIWRRGRQYGGGGIKAKTVDRMQS